MRITTSKTLRALSVLVFTTAAAATAAHAGEWHQWRGPDRTGYAPDTPPLIESLPDTGLKPLWRVDGITGGSKGGWGSPVVADGRVYVFVHEKKLRDGVKLGKRKYPWLAPNKRGHLSKAEYQQYEINRRDEDERIARSYMFVEQLHCYDTKTGEKLWVNERESVYTRFVQSGTVATHDGKLYILGAARTARCIDAKSGKDVWTTKLPGDFRDEFYMSSFAIADGAAVVVAGQLFGVDAGTGELLWVGDERATRGTHTSPVPWEGEDGKQRIIVNAGGNDTICVEPRTGRELWRVQTGGGLSTPIVLPNHRMLTYGNSRKKGLRCYAISTSGAEELWSYHGVSDSGSSPVVVGDRVFVQGDIRFACVDLKSGEETWQTMLKLERPRYTSPVAAGDQVFYTWQKVMCVKADAKEFTPLYIGMINEDGVLATEATHRRLLGIDDAGQDKADKVFRSKVERHGPLNCATPAIADGLIYMRTNKGLVCYDLRR